MDDSILTTVDTFLSNMQNVYSPENEMSLSQDIQYHLCMGISRINDIIQEITDRLIILERELDTLTLELENFNMDVINDYIYTCERYKKYNSSNPILLNKKFAKYLESTTRLNELKEHIVNLGNEKKSKYEMMKILKEKKETYEMNIQ